MIFLIQHLIVQCIESVHSLLPSNFTWARYKHFLLRQLALSQATQKKLLLEVGFRIKIPYVCLIAGQRYKDTDKRDWKKGNLCSAVRKKMFKILSVINHVADHMPTKTPAQTEDIGKQKLVMNIGGYYLHFATY